MRLLLAASAAAFLLAGCGALRADGSTGAASLSPTGAAWSRPSLSATFTSTGQNTEAVRALGSLSADTYANAVLTGSMDNDSIRRALFPAIARGQSLDIVFAIDTTGSMGPMIDSVKAELHGVIATLAATNPDTRYGIVAYRDRSDTDTFVTRVGFSLDGDQRRIHEGVDWLNPLGGGDYPEHVYAGLDTAIRGAGNWRPNAAHHIVLVGDAPPHDDYPDGLGRSTIIAEARARAIRIHTVTVACSFVCKKELGL